MREKSVNRQGQEEPGSLCKALYAIASRRNPIRPTLRQSAIPPLGGFPAHFNLQASDSKDHCCIDLALQRHLNFSED